MLLAISPALVAGQITRKVGIALLLISTLLAVQGYPAFQQENDAYRKRVRDKSEMGAPGESRGAIIEVKTSPARR